MIIFGTKTVQLATSRTENSTCPFCESKGTLTYVISRDHAHVYWIPFFPVGKKGYAECQHCRYVIDANDMPEHMRREYKDVKNSAKGPLWQFTGLGLIALLFFIIAFNNNQKKHRTAEFISAPLKGDVYKCRLDEGGYSTLKVLRVSNDSVFVSPNIYETNRLSGLDQIDKAENYSSMRFGLSSSELQKMLSDREIIEVRRRNN